MISITNNIEKMEKTIKSSPDYKLIFTDIIRCKYPDKEYLINSFLKKDKLSSLDVIQVNQLIFQTKTIATNKYRSYKKNEIIEILEFQETNNLTNRELSDHFQVSKNTITKWKKSFQIKVHKIKQ